MISGPADLHTHSTHSDGLCSPGDLVRAAATVGLAALAITDHDTLSAIPIAQPEAQRLGLHLIPGVEITADYRNRTIHLLGHFLDPNHAPLQSALLSLRTARLQRLSQLADRLEHLGYPIDLNALRSHWPRASLGRRHLALWLARTGQVQSPEAAFLGPLADHQTADLPSPRLPWADALALIHAAGGTSALAHPPRWLTLADLARLQAAGLTALEVDSPRLSRSRSGSLRQLANRLNLVPIAGSDFHAPDRPGSFVGRLSTPANILGQLLDRKMQPPSTRFS
ncbi:MAG: phosphatase [Isosphaeraceae bacterium]|jgi:predicted metal-dependent phosphoesterase TrpH|nr:MAG: phosphatase [Isosphaeraceae bacterium]